MKLTNTIDAGTEPLGDKSALSKFSRRSKSGLSRMKETGDRNSTTTTRSHPFSLPNSDIGTKSNSSESRRVIAEASGEGVIKAIDEEINKLSSSGIKARLTLTDGEPDDVHAKLVQALLDTKDRLEIFENIRLALGSSKAEKWLAPIPQRLSADVLQIVQGGTDDPTNTMIKLKEALKENGYEHPQNYLRILPPHRSLATEASETNHYRNTLENALEGKELTETMLIAPVEQALCDAVEHIVREHEPQSNKVYAGRYNISHGQLSKMDIFNSAQTTVYNNFPLIRNSNPSASGSINQTTMPKTYGVLRDGISPLLTHLRDEVATWNCHIIDKMLDGRILKSKLPSDHPDAAKHEESIEKIRTHLDQLKDGADYVFSRFLSPSYKDERAGIVNALDGVSPEATYGDDGKKVDQFNLNVIRDIFKSPLQIVIADQLIAAHSIMKMPMTEQGALNRDAIWSVDPSKGGLAQEVRPNGRMSEAEHAEFLGVLDVVFAAVLEHTVSKSTSMKEETPAGPRSRL